MEHGESPSNAEADLQVRSGMRNLRDWNGRAATVFILAAAAVGARPAAQQRSAAQPTPFVQLEKTRFATNERVFFWIGIDAPAYMLIPDSFYDSCQVTIVRPDGTRRVDKSSQPVDGPRGRSWRGGHGLGSEVPQLGRYTIIFECGGHTSAPRSFVVEDLAVLNQIAGEFLYSSPLALDSPDATATLVVRNGSNEVIRFPHLGGPMGLVWMKLDKMRGDRWSSSFPIPETVLLEAAGIGRSVLAPDTFTWKLVDEVPTVTLQPGESFELRLPVAEITSQRSRHAPPGDYAVEMTTTLQVLVGAPSGAYASYSPLRIDVRSTATGTFGAR
ncbi:MAG TPA: hypothetical protein VFV95_05720 [Vicinamibacterales bacterium]|nr:hypothetical protein [Vicinamibacterales bacterium]